MRKAGAALALAALLGLGLAACGGSSGGSGSGGGSTGATTPTTTGSPLPADNPINQARNTVNSLNSQLYQEQQQTGGG